MANNKKFFLNDAIRFSNCKNINCFLASVKELKSGDLENTGNGCRNRAKYYIPSSDTLICSFHLTRAKQGKALQDLEEPYFFMHTMEGYKLLSLQFRIEEFYISYNELKQDPPASSLNISEKNKK